MHALNVAGSYALDPQFHSLTVRGDQDLMKGIKESLVFFTPDTATYRRAYEQFFEFKDHVMSDEEEQAARIIHPQKWWVMYGVAWPDLQDAAIRILAVSCSNAPAERNFSSWGWIMKGRPELSISRAAKLVYVYTNLREIRKQMQKSKKTAIAHDYIKRELDYLCSQYDTPRVGGHRDT